MTDATKVEPCADAGIPVSDMGNLMAPADVGIRTSGSQVDNDAVLKQLAELPDLGEELQQIALQRLTDAGEIQAALERIAELENELQNIINANPRKWGAFADANVSHFESWAKSRARWALKGKDAL